MFVSVIIEWKIIKMSLETVGYYEPEVNLFFSFYLVNWNIVCNVDLVPHFLQFFFLLLCLVKDMILKRKKNHSFDISVG